MKVTIFKKDLDKAVKQYKQTKCTTYDCLIAQVGKRILGNKFKEVGFTIIDTNNRSYGVSSRNEERACMWKKLIHLFDAKRYAEIREMLPQKFELE